MRTTRLLMPRRHDVAPDKAFPAPGPARYDQRLAMSESPYATPHWPCPAEGRSGLLGRTLLAVARQRPGLDEARCRLVLDYLETAAAVHTGLRRALSRQNLTELRFFVLVAMFALDPEPSTAADLAGYSGVTRSSITDALDGLQTSGLVQRERDTTDRRIIYIRLTERGRAMADQSVSLFLRTAGSMARHIDAATQAVAERLYAGLREGAQRCIVP